MSNSANEVNEVKEVKEPGPRYAYYPYVVRYIKKDGTISVKHYRKKYKLKRRLNPAPKRSDGKTYNPKYYKPKPTVAIRKKIKQYENDHETLRKISSFLTSLESSPIQAC
jgi:hypothetical protein